jgi:hypothetical protein
MTIDNTLTTGKLKMTYVILLAMTVALIVYSAFELNASWVLYAELSALFLFILAYSALLILKMDYFYINDDAKKITIRFYSAHPFFRKYKTFSFSQSAFVGYEIRNSLFGLRKELILKGKNQKGEFTFPSVSISALSKVETDYLKRFLKKYLPNH